MLLSELIEKLIEIRDDEGHGPIDMTVLDGRQNPLDSIGVGCPAEDLAPAVIIGPPFWEKYEQQHPVASS